MFEVGDRIVVDFCKGSGDAMSVVPAVGTVTARITIDRECRYEVLFDTAQASKWNGGRSGPIFGGMWLAESRLRPMSVIDRLADLGGDPCLRSGIA